MGLYPRRGIWWMSYTVNGEQQFESTKTRNKRMAQQIFDARKAQIVGGHFGLMASNAPRFEQFSSEFLASIRKPSTNKRYTTSVRNLLAFFGNIALSNLRSDAIERFKSSRLEAGTRSATVNRDLAVARRMLKIAAKKRFVSAHLAAEIEFLEERKERRQPHIVSLQEEERLLAVAPSHIRVFVVLILETGMRTRSEALALKWSDVDFVERTIRVRESKSVAGIRVIRMSQRCKSELEEWRSKLGPQLPEYIFPKLGSPESHLEDVRVAWEKTLKDAGVEKFWMYDLRHTFASRMTSLNVSPVFLAQIMGHSSTNVLQTYARATDEYRRSAIDRLDQMRAVHNKSLEQAPASTMVQ